mmetsp:Transcript_5126/g.6787  ORF Transcript_5126/g.6787 Transcript_5126/m.6787 type:complete len:88 (+) Transcript_5126:225-488(+)
MLFTSRVRLSCSAVQHSFPGDTAGRGTSVSSKDVSKSDRRECERFELYGHCRGDRHRHASEQHFVEAQLHWILSDHEAAGDALCCPD